MFSRLLTENSCLARSFPYVQDIIKGLIIVVAVVIDQYRNKRKTKR
ncbi:hypothetical protein [Pseudomonas meliae]|nr:hypothetical protein [Pseudomonas meliae]